ncbi:hypothetical protein ABH922_000942 [Rhodococcus sp. 27YEA15]|uniref:hypothetical protein n=1 Tax=Rhodococcus sp. 27YEA15 TaxID=3156259 RepID=UPI003C79B643
MTIVDPKPETSQSRWAWLDPIILGVLIFNGFTCAVLSVLFLPTYIGSTPFPISILVAAVVNLALVVTARGVTKSGTAALPLIGWVAGFVLCMIGGPGGDVLVLSSPLTLLLVAGALVPAGVFLVRVVLNRLAELTAPPPGPPARSSGH